MEKPKQRSEGLLIEHWIKAEMKTSYRKAADLIGISDARLRQIANGYSSHGGGQYLEVVAPADRLAAIADALGIPASDLRGAGRSDAADLLEAQQERNETVSVSGDDQGVEQSGVGTIKARKPANMSDEDFKRLLDEYQEEIEWKLDRAARER